MYCTPKKQGNTKENGTFFGGELWRQKAEEKVVMLKIVVE